LSANKALLLETAGSTVQVGSFEPQLPLTYNNALLIGQFIGAGPTPPPYGIVSYDGTGIYTATLDINSATAGLVSGVSSSWSSSRLKPLTA
jgi:hypothetical protein